jgi:hypothetical protein
MGPRKTAAEQARVLRALTHQIDRNDSPLPDDVLVWVADDRGLLDELRRRSAYDADLSLEDALATART